MGKFSRAGRRGSFRWLSILGLLALIAAALVAVTSGSSSATGDARPAAPGGYDAAGIVRLYTGTKDKVVYTSEATPAQPAGTTLGTQYLGEQSCVLKSLGPDTILGFSAGAKKPGFAGDSIGVSSVNAAPSAPSSPLVASTGGSQGVPCSRVEASAGEALTLDLAGKVDELLVHRADLDIEVKSSAKIVATLFNAGQPAGSFELRSGLSVKPGLGSTIPGSAIWNCSARSDSGPDSGARDNCRWVLTGLFDKVTLTPTVGAFSLEGGADGYGTSPSTFYLAEQAPTGTVTCPSDVGEGTTSDLEPQVGDDYSTSGHRSEDADGNTTCTPIDYDLTFDGTTLHFTKRGTPVPNATFIFETTFAPEPTGSGDSTFGLEPTKHTFDNDPTHTVFDLLGCEGTPIYDGNGDFAGIQDILTTPGFDLVPGAPGVQYACVFDESTSLAGPGMVQLTQGVFLIGDWVKFR